MLLFCTHWIVHVLISRINNLRSHRLFHIAAPRHCSHCLLRIVEPHRLTARIGSHLASVHILHRLASDRIASHRLALASRRLVSTCISLRRPASPRVGPHRPASPRVDSHRPASPRVGSHLASARVLARSSHWLVPGHAVHRLGSGDPVSGRTGHNSALATLLPAALAPIRRWRHCFRQHWPRPGTGDPILTAPASF